MNHSEHDNIDNYLLNKMNDMERHAFEQNMLADTELKEEVRLRKEAMQMLVAVRNTRMRSTLDQIHDSVSQKPKAIFPKKLLLALLTALFTIGLLYYFLIYKVNQAVEPEKIYAQYFEPYPFTVGDRGDTATSQQLQEVNTLYKKEDYLKALPLFDKLLENSNESKLLLAAGISAIETDAYAQSISYFDKLIEKKDPFFQSQANWYGALAALKMGDTALAKSYLQALKSFDSAFKKEESREILEQLEK